MNILKEQSLSGIKWSAIEKFSLQSVQFFIGIIMARLLTPSDYGIIGMLAIFLAIGQSFVDCGFSNALIRKLDRTYVDYSTAFYFNILVGGVCYGILFLIAPNVAFFFETPLLKDVLRVLSINLFISSLGVVQRAIRTINVDFKYQAKVNVVSTIFSGVAGILFAYNDFGIWALVYQSVLNNALATLLFWLTTKWHPSLCFSIKSFKTMFSYGSKLLLSGLLHTIYEHMSTIVIGKYYTPKDLGYYSRGSQMAHLPSTTVMGVLQRVSFPILAKLQNDDKKLIDAYRKYICYSSMVIFFVMCVLAAVAKPLVIVLLTEKWLGAVIFVQIFCFSMMFGHISIINLNLLQVKGRSDLYLKVEVYKKAISFLILVASIPFGVIAICLSKVVYTQIGLFINTYYTGTLFNLGYFKQLKDFSVYFVFSIIACLPSYFLCTFTKLNEYILLVTSLIVSVVFYYVLLQKNSYMINFVTMIRNKIRK